MGKLPRAREIEAENYDIPMAGVRQYVSLCIRCKWRHTCNDRKRYKFEVRRCRDFKRDNNVELIARKVAPFKNPKAVNLMKEL